MTSDFDHKTLTVNLDELITLLLCRRFNYETDIGTPILSELSSDAESLLPDGEISPVSAEIERDGYRLILEGIAHRITADGIFLIVETDIAMTIPSVPVKRRARAYAFLLAAMLKCQTTSLHLIYLNKSSGQSLTDIETPKSKDIEEFYRRACRTLDLYAPIGFETVKQRRPSMAALRFPFPKKRQGQGELMKAVYTAIRRSNRLYASAPTGIGKTMSVLYPAVRALGEGHIEKIFYLTPKGTVARAAADAVTTLSEQGAHIRAVRLYAKETLCSHGVLCREDKAACKNCGRSESAYDRAVADLLAFPKEHAVIEFKDIKEVAVKHRVCPHELALNYSEMADIVIGDYHYLFDPHVSLRRYFSDCGDYCFLIDEAHNLVERGREIYSASVTSTDLASLHQWTRAHSTALTLPAKKACESFEKNMNAYLSDHFHHDRNGEQYAHTSTKALPEETLNMLEYLVLCAEEEWLKYRIEEAERQHFRQLLLPIQRFVQTAQAHGADCAALMTYTNGIYQLKSYCINPADRLAACLNKGKAAVLFSATMEPLHYYQNVLGADRHSQTLALPSPFPEENLAVAVVDGVSLRYLDRQQTLSEISRAICATVQAKTGNYLVFCPSFEYLDSIAALTQKSLRDARILRQTRTMSKNDRQAFLDCLTSNPTTTTVGFAVMGGVFSESVDLTGDRLIGSIVIGVGLPVPSLERETCASYYDDKCDAGREYAYLYPGMNRVWQAAGRVIRTEQDRGILLLIDDRFKDPFYRAMIPPHFRRNLRFTANASSLAELFRRFWSEK